VRGPRAGGQGRGLVVQMGEEERPHRGGRREPRECGGTGAVVGVGRACKKAQGGGKNRLKKQKKQPKKAPTPVHKWGNRGRGHKKKTTPKKNARRQTDPKKTASNWAPGWLSAVLAQTTPRGKTRAAAKGQDTPRQTAQARGGTRPIWSQGLTGSWGGGLNKRLFEP